MRTAAEATPTMEDPITATPVHRHRYSYGSDPNQWGELFLPERADPHSRGVAVVIHGGYWRSRYGAELGEPVALDLARTGIPAWNLEYRRGNGGGWPATFQDILAGIGKLRDLAEEHGLELGKVALLGHSAGGHLAVWAAGQQMHHGVRLTGVVSQSGVLNLALAEELNLSDGAVANLLGGPSSSVPERYRSADPMAALPLDVPVVAVHAEDDADVPLALSATYVAASGAGSVPARLVTVPGDHFALIDPSAEAYAICRDLVRGLLT